MAKKCRKKQVKKKNLLFGDGNNDSDSDGNDDFNQYIKEKSAKSKKLSTDASVESQVDFSKDIIVPSSTHATKSSYINELLESKRQRDEDKLYMKSKKLKLERELTKEDSTNDATEEEFITESYKHQKQLYEDIEKSGDKQQKLDDLDLASTNNLQTGKGVALKMLLAREKETSTLLKNSIPNESSNELDIANYNHTKIIIKNDRYENPNKTQLQLQLPIGESKKENNIEILDPILKRKLVEQFLTSKLTTTESLEIFKDVTQTHS
ncbi:hypothetical protein Kpol_1071p2 [Vanderwaltozyma polyspora DSM 70294]|uniref:Nuclear speckle splicing regulatory protein 1 N-terminal domain-containing protein n=1 Tax=Vanderwaltozyma polyspora (strain ATCC 22028 / DSM 70294 / BCRC 21397 / CBS 2163 / NBRC 10782 / NRRL Y-8283 / UCD 57-17) TaxID=436907 RepID=A7TRJ8_VANPO|nr:uncharacterized protein Kpol_1071p2 [Vanderwaltozyma polyspora DSM 70294]EDO15096.1 hypothetical protein Kpol_1071p2 [Vanderwaltozyma polyspora DSM 70294]